MKRLLRSLPTALVFLLAAACTLAAVGISLWQFWLALPHCFLAAVFAVTALWGADLARRLWDRCRELLP